MLTVNDLARGPRPHGTELRRLDAHCIHAQSTGLQHKHYDVLYRHSYSAVPFFFLATAT